MPKSLFFIIMIIKNRHLLNFIIINYINILYNQLII